MRSPIRHAAVLVAALALGCGCTSKVTGSVKLDGEPFVATECRSGAAFNFSGIQLADASGRKLRLVQRVDGGISAAVFAPGQAKGDMLDGNCGTIEIQTQNSRINNIRNVEGRATLSCSGGGHTLDGTVEFENCH